jgi:hypothetical protein
MIQNTILLQRICRLVAQTFAVSLDATTERIKMVGIEAAIEELENQDNKLRY